MSYKLKIKILGHDLFIQFSNAEELKEKLKELKEIISLIKSSQVIASISPMEPLAQYRDLYTYTLDGKLRLLRFPAQKADIIRLTLFLADRPLSVNEVREITGIENPKAYMKSTDFIEVGKDTYALNSNGKRKVVEEIIPKLRERDGE